MKLWKGIRHFLIHSKTEGKAIGAPILFVSRLPSRLGLMMIGAGQEMHRAGGGVLGL